MSGRRQTVALAGGAAVSGLMAYAVFAITTRALGAAAAAPVSVLWTWWGFAGAAFTFPLQHWVTRTVSAYGEGAVRAALPRVGLAVLAVSGVTGGLAWLGRDALFHRADAWFPLMVLLVTLGSSLIGLARGGLGARERYAAVGASLVAENLVRLLAVTTLVIADVTSPVAFGACLVAGQLCAFLWPSALRFAAGGSTLPASRAFVFLAGTGLSQLVAQVVLTSAPVVLALGGGSPADVTALFAAMALFRAPYLLVQGSVAPLTVRLTRLVVAGDAATLSRVRRGLLGLTVLTVPLAWGAGAWLGPGLLRLVFGPDIRLAPHLVGLVAVGCTLAVVNLLVAVDVLAHDRSAHVAVAWVGATLAGAVTYALLHGLDPTDRTVWAFVAAEAAAQVGLLVLLPRDRAEVSGRA
ncbi:MAG: hypothetical protein ABWX84_09780 [Nocardioides sp.]